MCKPGLRLGWHSEGCSETLSQEKDMCILFLTTSVGLFVFFLLPFCMSQSVLVCFWPPCGLLSVCLHVCSAAGTHLFCQWAFFVFFPNTKSERSKAHKRLCAFGLFSKCWQSTLFQIKKKKKIRKCSLCMNDDSPHKDVHLGDAVSNRSLQAFFLFFFFMTFTPAWHGSLWLDDLYPAWYGSGLWLGDLHPSLVW